MGTYDNEVMTRGLFAFLGAYSFVGLIITAVLLVAMWKIFEKAGQEGWKAIVPLYNLYILYQLTWGNGIYCLLLLIPVVNVVVGLLTIYKLGQSFGKSMPFTLGMMFLPVIFLPLLAFGPDKYLGVVGK